MLPVCVLAGGLATRMLPLTKKIPKSLLPVNGKPFIDLQLTELQCQGVSQVVLCLGHLGELVEQHTRKQSYQLRLFYSYDGEAPLGTGGAVKKAIPLLGEHFFVLYGDSWLNIDYREVQNNWQLSGKKTMMTFFRNNDLWDKSNVDFMDGNVRYSKNCPTSEMRYIDYGLGILSAACFDGFSGKFDLAEVYEQLSDKGELFGYEAKNRFYEIGSMSGLVELENYLFGIKNNE